MRIYAACLASYNNGVLHGAWIDASSDVDTMQDAINAMLRNSKYPNVMVKHPETGEQVASAEEWAIHDYDGNWPGFGEYPGLQAIADYMELIELGAERDMSPELVAAIVDNFGREYLESAKEAIEEHYCGEHDSLEDFAAQFIEDTTDLSAIPENLRNYIDYEALGRDMELGGDIWSTRVDGTLHIFWNH